MPVLSDFRIVDDFYLWEAFQGINNSRVATDFRIIDNYYLYLVILAGSTGSANIKGYIDCSGNPNYPAATIGDIYEVSVKGKIGGAAGVPVEPGDLLICFVTSPAGTQAAVGANWDITQFGLQQIFEITGSDLSFAVLQDLNQTVGRDYALSITNDWNIIIGGDTNTVSLGNYTATYAGNVSTTAVGTWAVSSTKFNVTTGGLMGVNIAVPLATIHGVGAGNTSATVGLRIDSSTVNNIFSVLNDSEVLINGSRSITLNLGGLNNNFFGTLSGSAAATNANNTAVGASSLAAITGGYQNTAIGVTALASITNGGGNTAGGYLSCVATTGNDNTAWGSGTLQANTSGGTNTAIGLKAGNANTTGGGSVFVGYYAGAYATTAGNEFYLNNQDRTNNANDKALSLIYGVFAAAAANQRINLNAGFIKTTSLTVYANNAAAAGAGLVTGEWYLVADAVTGSNIIEVVV